MGSSVVETMNKKNITDSLNVSGNDGANSLTNHLSECRISFTFSRIMTCVRGGLATD